MAPAPTPHPVRRRSSATCASARRCRGWRSSARNRPG
ncbi:MAG TPA: hypothetical protein DIC37_00645, partial [Pseudomonas sp.]|nr:hypothetical protein [Pseudomonas sp.]